MQDITTQTKKSSQTRGAHIKPRLTKLFETQKWQQGDTDKLKFLGFETTNSEVCLYFPRVQDLPLATSDPHYLLHYLQLSRSQATTKEMKVNLDGRASPFNK